MPRTPSTTSPPRPRPAPSHYGTLPGQCRLPCCRESAQHLTDDLEHVTAYLIQSTTTLGYDQKCCGKQSLTSVTTTISCRTLRRLSYAGRANIAMAEFQAELKRRLRPEGKDSDYESSDEESITSDLWTVEAPTANGDEENFVR